MADRIVKVVLEAKIDGLKRSMAEASEATETSVQKQKRELAALEKQLAEVEAAAEKVGQAALGLGALMAAGVGVAIAKSADFNEAMSFVAATGEDARDSFDALRVAAIDAGASTVFSATESANAIEEMAKAGVSAEDILGGGLTGALDLAAAGGLGVAEAAEYAATAMNMFNLAGEDMEHIADLLAAGAGKAMGDVSDMGSALNQAGLVASKMGLSIEETTATLAAFAQQGLLGSDAGTSLKTMLQRLTPVGGPATQMFEDLGFTAFNANGEFAGMEELAGRLQTALKGMSTEQRSAALNVMFGADAIRGANVLIDEGAEGIAKWTDAVNDQGYAAETAGVRLDNLKGDWEGFTGALDSALISIGDAADGPARGFIQFLTDLVDAFNDMPDWMADLTLWTGVVIAAIALTGGAAMLAVPKIKALGASFVTLFKATSGASWLAGGGILLAITAVTAAVGALAGAHAEGKARAEEYGASLEASTLLATADTYELVAKKMTEAQDGWDFMFADRSLSGADAAKGLGMDVAEVTKIIADGGLEFLQLSNRLDDLKNNTDGAADALANKLGKSTRQVKVEAFNLGQELKVEGGHIKDIREEILATAEATGEAADGQALLNLAMQEGSPLEIARAMNILATATEEVEPAAEDAADGLTEVEQAAKKTEDAIKAVTDAIKGFGNQELSISAAQRNLEAAFDDVTESIEKNGRSLDINEESGRANEQALHDIAQKAIEYTNTLAEQGMGQEAATAAMEDGRAKLIEMLAEFDITGQAAEDYADKLGLIPADVSTLFELNGLSAADVALQAWKDKWQGQYVDMTVRVNAPAVAPGGVMQPNYSGGMYANGVKEFYQGGFASGIYDGVQGGIHKFAEKENGVPWEAYISGRPADRDRNIGIAMESLNRMGVRGGGGGSTTQVDAPISIIAPPGMSPSQAAQAAAEQLNYALRG